MDEVKEELRKEKHSFFAGLFSSRKKRRRKTERQDLKRIQEELRAAVTELKGLL